MPSSIERFMAWDDELILDPQKRELEPEKGDKGFSIGRVKAGGVSEENRTVTGVLSTPSVDRYEEIVEPEAFREWLPYFIEDNPKFLPNHSHGSGSGEPSSIGHWESLEIIKAALIGTAKFLPAGDPLKLADAWWFRFLHGSQKTFSVAWITHAWEMREFELAQGVKKNIRVFTEVELIEISAVEIPANRDAKLIRAAAHRAGLVEAAALDDHQARIKQVAGELLPHLSPDQQRELVKDVLIKTLTDPDGPLPSLIEETVQQTVAALGYGEGSDGLTPGSPGSGAPRSGPPTQEAVDDFTALVLG